MVPGVFYYSFTMTEGKKSFNQRFAEAITSGVATMWCAYLFAGIALISLPNAIKSGDALVIVSWIAQTFLQLVLLSIIMVGQKAESKRVEQQINETHDASIKELGEIRELQAEVHRIIKDLEGRVN